MLTAANEVWLTSYCPLIDFCQLTVKRSPSLWQQVTYSHPTVKVQISFENTLQSVYLSEVNKLQQLNVSIYLMCDKKFVRRRLRKGTREFISLLFGWLIS